MQETLEEFCAQYGVTLVHVPQPFFHSRNIWLIEDTAGKKWVVKKRSPEDKSVETLKGFSILHPPFRYPQPVSKARDPYLMYPFIEGQVLADQLFEKPEIIERVSETIGRVQTIMRSLILVPFYQETLRLKEQVPHGQEDPLDRMTLGTIHKMDDQKKKARHVEIAESFNWTKTNLRSFCGTLQSNGLLPQDRLDQYQDLMENNFSLHLPIFGTSLTHSALHPEHLLLCSDGEFAVLSWRIDSRPRFYMPYTYLAWSLLHSNQSDPTDFYRELLNRLSSKAFTKEHHLVFALCLLEQVSEVLEKKSGNGYQPSDKRLRETCGFFLECLDTACRFDAESP